MDIAVGITGNDSASEIRLKKYILLNNPIPTEKQNYFSSNRAEPRTIQPGTSLAHVKNYLSNKGK